MPWQTLRTLLCNTIRRGCEQTQRRESPRELRQRMIWCTAYDMVHSAVAGPGSGYVGQPGFQAALEHSPEHVRTIRGVFG
ncbi:hypothetical protein COCOBI_11-5660 [Coccomyxa sp. Obi]|nr:hypothetical protein COCOBI_11-5660 [Coccomyxa sp. Obi]